MEGVGRARREVVLCKALGLTRVSASAISSGDIDERVAVVPNMLLSQEEEI